jgi:hypothetical protein
MLCCAVLCDPVLHAVWQVLVILDNLSALFKDMDMFEESLDVDAQADVISTRLLQRVDNRKGKSHLISSLLISSNLMSQRSIYVTLIGAEQYPPTYQLPFSSLPSFHFRLCPSSSHLCSSLLSSSSISLDWTNTYCGT